MHEDSVLVERRAGHCVLERGRLQREIRAKYTKKGIYKEFTQTIEFLRKINWRTTVKEGGLEDLIRTGFGLKVGGGATSGDQQHRATWRWSFYQQRYKWVLAGVFSHRPTKQYASCYGFSMEKRPLSKLESCGIVSTRTKLMKDVQHVVQSATSASGFYLSTEKYIEENAKELHDFLREHSSLTLQA